MLWSLLLVK